MARMTPVNVETATGSAKAMLETVQKHLGVVPNMMQLMAQSPLVLECYMNFNGALGKGSLKPTVREQIALAVAEVNECEYCLAAHTAISKMMKMDDEVILAARRGEAADAKLAPVLNFARLVVKHRGQVSEGDIKKLTEAGYDQAQIAEIIANVALAVFTNYFNVVAQTDCDFPAAPVLIQ